LKPREGTHRVKRLLAAVLRGETKDLSINRAASEKVTTHMVRGEVFKRLRGGSYVTEAVEGKKGRYR